MKMRRPLAIISRLLVALALTTGAVAVATPAHAVTCYGDYCSGQDPEASGCASGSYTATSYNHAEFSLQVRYSPTCQTNWTRIVMYSPGWNCTRSGTIRAVQDTGYTQSKYVDSVCGSGFTRWTPMIYSPVRQVQGRFVDQNGTWYYTPWA
jgi:hypothetical protein